MDGMNLFQQLWQNWERRRQHIGPGYTDEMPWLNELNQAVLAQLEKRCPSHIQLRVVDLPAFIYYFEEEGSVRSAAETVMSQRVIVPEGNFEDRIELATELLLELIDQPGVQTAFLYWPLVPEGLELHDGSPNRKYLKTRLQTTPNVAVDAPGKS